MSEEASSFPGGDVSLASGLTGLTQAASGQVGDFVSALIEATPDAMFVKDLCGRYLVLNSAAVKLIDRKKEQILGCTDHELFPREIADQIVREDREAIKTGARAVFEVTVQINGAPRILNITKAPFRNTQGEIAGVVGFIADVTERKHADVRHETFSYLGHRLNSAHSAVEAAKIIVEAAQQLFGWDASSFDLYSPEEELVYPLLNIDTINGQKREVNAAYSGTVPSRKLREVIDTGGELILRQEPITQSNDVIPFGDTSRLSASLIFVPVRNINRVIGLLSIQSYKPNAYDAAALETMQSLADYCGGALERIRAEELVRASEERYRRIVETAVEGIWIIDQNANTVFTNRSLEQLLGYESREMIGRSAFDFLPPEDRAAMQARLDHRRKGISGRQETRYVHKSGKIVWAIAASTPLLDSSGNFIGCMAMLSDISERKRAEDRLHFLFESSVVLSSSLDYKTALQNLARLTAPHFADWCLIDVISAEGQFEHLGLENADPSKIEAVLQVYHSGPEVDKAFSEVLRSGQPKIISDLAKELPRAGSCPVMQQLASFGVKSCIIVPLKARQKVLGTLTLAQADSNRSLDESDLELADLLGRRAAIAVDNAQLYHIAETERSVALENESFFRNLSEAIPHMVWTCAADGAFEYCNHRWREYTGQTTQQSQWPGWLDAVHAEHRDRVARRWEHSVHSGELFECEYLLRRGLDGTYRWHIDRALPLRDVQGKVIKWFGTCTDIHDKKHSEELARQMNQELERRVNERTVALQEINNQMEAFCYSISHDLRAPLRAMRSFTQVLLEDYAPALDKTGQDFLQRVGSSAERMDKLILDLLEYSRLGRVQLTVTPIALEKVMENVLLDLRFEFREKKATLDLIKPLPAVVANETVLKQIFFNLVNNALKFIAWDTAPQVKIWSEDVPGSLPRKVRVWVEDNGIGIAKEHHERIFRVFERLHGVHAYPGTGIGLAIVQKGCERLGGRVGVESRLGKGSKFWVELLKADEADAGVTNSLL